MRTGNPVLNDKTFENFGVYRRDAVAEQSAPTTMTPLIRKRPASSRRCATSSVPSTGAKAP